MRGDEQRHAPDQSIDTGGGAYVQGDVQVSGDFVGRDKVIQNIDTFVQRGLSAAEQAKQQKEFEAEHLAQGVSVFAQRLRAHAGETADAVKGGPYKGLIEYRLSDAEIFFGRERAIRELLQHLQRGPLTVLHAESGAGKTSLLQAGIAPRLIAAEHLAIHLRPYDVDPALAIKRAFLPNLDDTPRLAAAPLREFLRQVSGVLGLSVGLYVFLDQFEEFFVQLDAPAQQAFVEALAECMDDPSLNVRWVLALRTEFFGNLATFRPRIRNPFENDYRLNRLTRAEAQAVVTRPAELRGISFEPGLVETLLDDLGQDAVSPPQLQLVCQALYEGLEPDETLITQALYKDQGGVAGILRGHLDRVLKRDLPADQRPAARRLLEALVTSERRRALRTREELTAELRVQGVDETMLERVLEQMVDSRLLRVEESDEEGAARAYELAHDYLLEEIELDPVAQARKAAQELLTQELQTYRRYHTLLSAEKLALLEPQGANLILDADASDLLFRSAQARGRALKRWRDYALRHRLTGALAQRWVTALENEDPAQANRAVQLLVNLSDAEAVSCLSGLIEAQAPTGQENPLRHASPVQQRALAALAQMACPEAEAYLQRLTPQGFCLVPAGPFDMRSRERPEEQPRHPVWLAAFWMACFPVTVADWRRFIEAGAYTQVRYWTRSDQAEMAHRPVPAGWKVQADRAEHPVHNLTWYEAMAYAAWLAETEGLPVALPTEAEWEKAAGWDRAEGRMRRFPWGDAPDASCCNVQESGPGDTTPAGHYATAGASPWGAQDMAGNVLEWTRTEYRAYPYHPHDGREAASSRYPRVLRGGAFNQDLGDARCTRRHLLDPIIGLSNTGCRVCLRLAPLIPEGEEVIAASRPTPD